MAASEEFASRYTPADLHLKPYDFTRKPRGPVVTDDRTIAVPYKVLNAELQCPVCMSIVKNACVVMECLHRFCEECIHKCLRLGKKECPACRTHVPSKRSCRRDKAFDMLVRKVYRNPEEFAAREAAAISATNLKENFNSAYTTGVTEAVKAQKAVRKKGRTRAPKPVAATAASSRRRAAASAASGTGAGAGAGAGGGSTAGSVTGSKRRTPSGSAAAQAAPKRPRVVVPGLPMYALRRHPAYQSSCAELEKQFLRTSKLMTVGHLKLFLQRKLRQPYANFVISVVQDGEQVTLSDSLTIATLYEAYWQGDMNHMELWYYVPATVGNVVAPMSMAVPPPAASAVAAPRA